MSLDQRVISLLKEVFERYPEVKKVYLFGSRAKGNAKKGSDIDLFLVAPDMSFERYLSLYAELEDLDIPYKIDLVKDWQMPEEAVEIYSREP